MNVPKNVIFTIFLCNLYATCHVRWKRSLFFNEIESCECGRHDEPAPRIVGGDETEPSQYPWMVAIYNNGNIHCGGTLINDRYVLTAGHCLSWLQKENLTVVFGLHDAILKKSGHHEGITAEIDRVFIHEDFSSDYSHDTNDLGLMKLKKPIKFSPQVSPICLPKEEYDYTESPALVMGWGKTSQHGNPSKFLKKANVTIMSNEKCKTIPDVGRHLMDSMLCAYRFEADACQGDSGGPLTRESNPGKMEQIGIVSWGIGCAKPGIPGVYARITHYVDWISVHTSDAEYCKF